MIPWEILAGPQGPQEEQRAQTTTTNLDGGIESASLSSRDYLVIGVAGNFGSKNWRRSRLEGQNSL